MPTDSFWKYFYEIYEDLPRQGPGDAASTLRALKLLPALGEGSRLLDIGCGSGAQTLDLAKACPAQIVAMDNHGPFLSALEAKLVAHKLQARVKVEAGDMGALTYPESAFDVVWCEGAIFILGFEAGLKAFRKLAKPGGYLVVSEFCWFVEEPSEELKSVHLDGVPAAGSVASRRQVVADAGLKLVADFVLPDQEGWWNNYYVPLSEALARFRNRHAHEPEALAVADHCQHEIDVFQKYPGAFGYVFFVMQRPPRLVSQGLSTS